MKTTVETFPEYSDVEKTYPEISTQAKLDLYRERVRVWHRNFKKELQEDINNLPHISIDTFWQKYKKAKIAQWNKEDGFNAFMIGYIVRTREVLGVEAGGEEENEK